MSRLKSPDVEPAHTYDAYICSCPQDCVDEGKIRDYLTRNNISVAQDKTDHSFGNTQLIRQSKWFVFLLSKAALHDGDFTIDRIRILHEAINNGSALVVPVILEKDITFMIPDILRWVVYIQKTKDDSYLKQLLKTIQGIKTYPSCDDTRLLFRYFACNCNFVKSF